MKNLVKPMKKCNHPQSQQPQLRPKHEFGVLHTVDGWNPAPPGMYETWNNGIFTISTGAGFLPWRGVLLDSSKDVDIFSNLSFKHHFSRSSPKSELWTKLTSQHRSGQLLIFHQPRFPWNKGNSLTKPQFGVRLCEVAMIWPDRY